MFDSLENRKPSLDSVKIDNALKMAEERLEKEAGERLAEKLPDKMDMPSLPQPSDVAAHFEEGSTASIDISAKINQNPFLDKEKIEEGMENLEGIKNKYREVQDSRALKSGSKRNSLKGYAFWERLETGVSFAMPSFVPFDLEFSPLLGYRFNRKWSVGISHLFETTGKSPGSVNISSDGHEAYALYKLDQGFFAQAKYYHRGGKSSSDGANQAYQGIAGGLGTELSLIKRFWLRTSLMYMIDTREKQEKGTAWQVNIGIIYFKK